MEIKNKGTGAGGKNTNANGLNFEEMAYLDDYFSIITKMSYGIKIQFNGYSKEFIYLKKKEFSKWTQQLPVGEYNNIPKLHGTKEPDACFINEESKQIIILEKKFQNSGGSVAEKLQTPINKIRNAKAELIDLDEDNIPYYIGLSKDIKNQVVNEINNC